MPPKRYAQERRYNTTFLQHPIDDVHVSYQIQDNVNEHVNDDVLAGDNVNRTDLYFWADKRSVERISGELAGFRRNGVVDRAQQVGIQYRKAMLKSFRRLAVSLRSVRNDIQDVVNKIETWLDEFTEIWNEIKRSFFVNAHMHPVNPRAASQAGRTLMQIIESIPVQLPAQRAFFRSALQPIQDIPFGEIANFVGQFSADIEELLRIQTTQGIQNLTKRKPFILGIYYLSEAILQLKFGHGESALNDESDELAGLHFNSRFFTFSQLINEKKIDPFEFIRLWFLTKVIISDIDVFEHQDVNVINLLLGKPFNTVPDRGTSAFGQNISLLTILQICEAVPYDSEIGRIIKVDQSSWGNIRFIKPMGNLFVMNEADVQDEAVNMVVDQDIQRQINFKMLALITGAVAAYDSNNRVERQILLGAEHVYRIKEDDDNRHLQYRTHYVRAWFKFIMPNDTQNPNLDPVEVVEEISEDISENISLSQPASSPQLPDYMSRLTAQPAVQHRHIYHEWVDIIRHTLETIALRRKKLAETAEVDSGGFFAGNEIILRSQAELTQINIIVTGRHEQTFRNLVSELRNARSNHANFVWNLLNVRPEAIEFMPLEMRQYVADDNLRVQENMQNSGCNEIVLRCVAQRLETDYAYQKPQGNILFVQTIQKIAKKKSKFQRPKIYLHNEYGEMKIIGGRRGRIDICQMWSHTFIATQVQALKKKIKKHYVKSSKGRSKERDIVFYDMETCCGEGEQMLPYLISVFDGEIITFKNAPPHVLCLQFVRYIIKKAQFLNQKQELSVIAWNGAKFDLLLLIETIAQQMPQECKLFGSMTFARLITAGKIKFMDAMMMTCGGQLNNFAKSMGTPLKAECEEIKNIKTLADWTNLDLPTKEKIENYCKQDSVVAYAAFTAFQKKFNDMVPKITNGKLQSFQLKHSLPATAYEIMQHMLDTQITPLTDLKVYKAMRASYRGGMVQVFNTAEFHSCLYIDANSLYPYVMANKIYGTQYSQIDQYMPPINADNINKTSLYNIDFKLSAKANLGWFPVYLETKEIIYPLEGQNIYCWGHQIIQLLKSVEGPHEIKIFSEICAENEGIVFSRLKELYNIRAECKTRDPVFANIIKLFMNSCYGQFGMKQHSESSLIPASNNDQFISQLVASKAPTRKDTIPQIKKIEYYPNIKACLIKYEKTDMPESEKSRSVHIASQISSYARCFLLKKLYMLQNSGSKIIYCDTDSIVYQGKIMPSIMGAELGKFKEEYEGITLFQAFSPKMYLLRIGDRAVYKTKGVIQDKEKCEKIFLQIKENQSAEYEQIQFKRFRGTVTRQNIKKHIKLSCKRIQLNNGETMPYINKEQYQ